VKVKNHSLRSVMSMVVCYSWIQTERFMKTTLWMNYEFRTQEMPRRPPPAPS